MDYQATINTVVVIGIVGGLLALTLIVIRSDRVAQEKLDAETASAQPPAGQPDGQPSDANGASSPKQVVQSANAERSGLLPAGVVIMVLGMIGQLFAMASDVTPNSEGIVNIDALSHRSMEFDAGLVTMLAGIVLACTGRLINEVRALK